MKLTDAIAKLCSIEEGLTVEVRGREFKIVKAWPSFPPSGIGNAPNLPCTTHNWEMLPLPIASASPNGLRTLDYTIKIQLLIADTMPDADVYAEVAQAFNEALLVALVANLKLEDGSASIDNLRTEGEMPVMLENRFLGLVYLLDYKTTDVVTVGP